MITKIFMENIFDNVKSKKTPAAEKITCALSQNEAQIGKAKKAFLERGLSGMI